jgi:PAS domain S-box-containing protein
MLQKSVDSSSIQGWIGRIGLALAVAVAYFLTGELGLALLTTPERVAVFWPASGVAAGILIALGSSVRTPVAAGVIAATIAANVMLDRSLWAALALASCNAGEALLVAWLIERWSGPSFHLDSLRGVLTFLVAAIVGTATVAVSAAWAMSLFGPSTAAFLSVWQVWFASDVLGMITVAPLLIGLAAAVRNTPTRRELIEGTLALVALTVTNGFVLAWLTRPWLMIVPATLLFPLLLWLGARCRPVFTAAGVFIIAAAIVWTTTYELGLYGDPGLHIADRALAAQVAMLSTTLAGLALAALFDERRQQAAALIESEARLQEALSAGGVTTFDWDLCTGMTRRSENAAQMLGFDPKNPPSATEFLARMRPDDLARYKAFLQSVSPDRPSFAWSFRFTRFDGREIWLEQSSRAEFDAGGLVVHVRGLTLDVTERKQAEEHQSILMAELNHRVRNVLARVAGVAMSTRQGSGSMDDFVLRLNGRIQAMAVAHSVLSQSGWHGAEPGTFCGNSLPPTRRMRTRRSAVQRSCLPPRRRRHWRWCFTSW